MDQPSEFCNFCSKVMRSEKADLVNLARVTFHVTLCNNCYRKRKAGQLPDPSKAKLVADRVGADFFECECGQTVPMNESVRVMRKKTGRIDRVCVACNADTCTQDRHSIVTPQHKDWDEACEQSWSFQPVPESLLRGICSQCKLEMVYDGKRWRRMTWPALAEAWEKF
jgi:hypothetical protein